MREVYEMATYLVLIIVSCIVMGVWLKRKGKKKEQIEQKEQSEKQ